MKKCAPPPLGTVIVMFFSPQPAVLYLTCSNNHRALEEVLSWGKENGLGPRNGHFQDPTANVENENDYVGRNPILLAVLQGHQECTELLHQFGHRIAPKVIGPGKEKSPLKTFLRLLFEFDKASTKENQVQSVLEFKGFADPHYLAIAFGKKVATLMEDERWRSSFEQEENKDAEEEGGVGLLQVAPTNFTDFDSELKDLQELDPLRHAFDLAATAQDYTNDFQGIVELKKNYKEIKEDLEEFTGSLLSQCYNEEEAAMILKHNPDDDDDDDLDSEEQNWQRALWERRKRFVGHPFYQVSL